MSMIGTFQALSDGELEKFVADPEGFEAFLDAAGSPGKDVFDVDKAWHGIHFLLTGSAWDGSGPLAFILHGGREIDFDFGYGPAHGFTSTQVKEIASALQPIHRNALFAKADPAALTQEDIYPSIWDRSKEESIEYVTTYFGDLKQFIEAMAKEGRALIVYLS